MENQAVTKGRKNTDYSASAVNLKNPIEVSEAISKIKDLQNELDNLDATMHAYPEYQQMIEKQQEMAIRRKETETLIECFGSYQDVDKGWYGVKQRAITKSYNAGLFESCFPEFAPAVIIKAVDTVKLNGLLKGGLLTEEGLKRANILEEKESFRFIIK